MLATPKSREAAKLIVGAAQHADLDRVKELHAAGADLNAVHRNYRPIHALLQETSPHETAGKPSPERLKTLDWLLKHGADPELPGGWPAARALIIAAFTGSPEFIKHLLKAGATQDAFTKAALGEYDGSVVNERDPHGFTALMCAAGSRLPGKKTTEIVRQLLNKGADVKPRVNYWLHEVDAVYLAANAQRPEIFRLLLEHGADATEALTPSLWNGGDQFAELAEIALAHGADPNRATAEKQPLLNNLIRWGRLKQVMWLLEKGASPNIPDHRGWTAIHQAESRGNKRMLEACIKSGARLP